MRNNFKLCEWDNKIERESCESCKCVPDEIYYRRTCFDVDEGEYWCSKCIDREHGDNLIYSKIL
jgi:hypothetical protein